MTNVEKRGGISPLFSRGERKREFFVVIKKGCGPRKVVLPHLVGGRGKIKSH